MRQDWGDVGCKLLFSAYCIGFIRAGDVIIVPVDPELTSHAGFALTIVCKLTVVVNRTLEQPAETDQSRIGGYT